MEMLDLPHIWAVFIAIAVMLYVAFDGYDLGIGMLTAYAFSDQERNMMTATIEPFWDGNETWLVLGGGGLFAAFPLAYAILMPSFYLPILVMLAALIFRGVAFEFRHKAVRKRTQKFWNGAFAYGSLVATLSQGFILGGFIQGFTVEGRAFAGGTFDWFTPFSVLVALSMVAGYLLLGTTWLILKTEGELREGSIKWAKRSLIGTALGMALVSFATLSIDPRVTAKWGVSMATIDFSKAVYMLPIPLACGGLMVWLWKDLFSKKSPDWRPYLLAVGIFLTGYVGLGVSIFPYIVPFEVTIWEAAARDNALMLLFVGAAVMLPIILAYTAYVHSLFWGKVKEGDGYHG